MTYETVEPFFVCLIASMIWAPIVFLVARKLTSSDPAGVDDKIWPTALVAAALPAMLAPIVAAFGLSLRQPATLPPTTTPLATAATTIEPIAIEAAPATSISLAQVFETAALIYFYGFILFLLLGAIRLAHFSYRVRYAYELDEPTLEAGLEDWRQRMGIKRQPRYAFTDAIASVCVHGVFRPSILMPENLLDRVSIEDAILMGAHEMAHIKRHDTALFSLCTAVKAVFWFNPFMRHIAARANLAAEQAADALVVARGADRRRYAECFVQGLRFAANQRRETQLLGQELVPSFTPFDKKSRRARLDAILSGNAAPFINTPSKAVLAVTVVAAAGLAFAQAAFAVAPKPQQALPHAPVEGKIVLQFGDNPNARGKGKSHRGIDIKAGRGAAVSAAGDGKVTYATPRYRGQSGWGNVVVIDHGNGLVTKYAHLDSYIVKKGQMVSAGDMIGAVGSTGVSAEPHLHFEVLQDGMPIDPSPVLAAKPMPAPAPLDPQAPPPSPAPPSPEPLDAKPPAAPSFARNPLTSISDRIEDRLEGKAGKIDNRVTNAFEEFKEAFTGMEFARAAEEFAEQFADLDLSAPEIDSFHFEWDGKDHAFISKQTIADIDVDELREIQREAIREAREAMAVARSERADVLEKARHSIEKARNQAEQRRRDREQALRDREQAERDRAQAERDRLQAVRDREQAVRDREQAKRDKAQRKREKQMERAEQARARAEAKREARREAKRERAAQNGGADQEWISQIELLTMREEAVREAKESLERELEEIRRQREQLERDGS